jgi:hypothetical protein
MSVTPLLRTRDEGLEHKEGPCGITLLHIAERGWHFPGSAVPPRNLSCRDVVFHSRKPPRPGEIWDPSHWGDMDLDLLEFTTIRRRWSSCGTRELLFADLLPQVAAAEGMSCSLMVGARYIEWVVACAKFRPDVTRGSPGERRRRWVAADRRGRP